MQQFLVLQIRDEPAGFLVVFLQYYLKAKFHFNKDQFADLMVISGIAGTISQVYSAVIRVGRCLHSVCCSIYYGFAT